MSALHAPGLLLLAVIPFLVGFLAVTRASGPLKGGFAAAVTLRCLALLTLVLALAQPQWPGAPGALAVIADVSNSITRADRVLEADWLQKAVAAASSTNPLTVITFAGTAAASTLYRPVDHSVIDALVQPRADGARTDLASALRLAVGLVPPGTHVVLLSDGLPTVGNAAVVMPDLIARHLTLDTVLLGQQPADTAITRLSLPASAIAGTGLPLEVTLYSTRSVTATLDVDIDGHMIGRQALALGPGDNPYQISIPAQAPGWHAVRASVTAHDDAIRANDALWATTDVAGTPRVLLVTQRATGSIALAQLAAASLDVVPQSPHDVPVSVDALSQYAGVVLDDLPATTLTSAQVTALDTAVRRGVGLMVLGGQHSLTLGHFSQSALERMLPVLSNTPASLQDGNVALQLVLDRSGSMDNLAGDVPKIVMSRAAARLAAAFTLQHKDDLGILSFDQVSHILIPMERVAPVDKAHVDRVINGMFSDGGTNIYQALQMGIVQVSRSSAPYRHIILMTDGRSDPANYQPLLRQAQQHKVTISTVGLGPDADIQLLSSIASVGKGRFYYTTNAEDLPRIFAEEARLAAGSAAVTGDIGVRVAASSPTVRSLDAETLPHLHGYTATVLKPGAVNDLETDVQGRKPDPILAHWQYGLGRVLVWTPGLDTGWSTAWRRAVAGFWGDTFHWVLRGPGVATDAPSLDGAAGDDGVVIDTVANTGRAVELLPLVIGVHPPNGKTSRLVATQAGPGLYRAAYQFTTPGVYTVTVRSGADHGSARALLAVPYSQEYAPTRPNGSLLVTLSTATGGAALQRVDQLTTRGGGRAGLVAPWWMLALAALVLYCAALVMGRIAPEVRPKRS